MNVIIVKNAEEGSKRAAEWIAEQIRMNPQIVLGMATGGTFIETYRNLVEAYKEGSVSFRHVTTFNLDEYVGLPPSHPNSYRYYMDQHLFWHVDIDLTNTFVPNGMAVDLEEECRRYDWLIEQAGGIDVQLLGVGRNGHIGFNEPGTSFSARTHVVRLAESTRKANARFFKREEEVPTHAITVGIRTIMESKRILLVAFGKEKAAALRAGFCGEVTENVPVSILQKHHDVTIIADEEAWSEVE
ncbi:glucosamine-6-phosphate deaminase [Thermolongibacillus altinsuensis]|uniref:glucosamine-6-phosphate deaminase n=1 Tax=Thermolongibacillus altinsuensis TaxID=575256 RepID=UPI00242A2E71|nr:glucosamine-6-phosphate deaminase [Thermolongibacillus altinsuensis]GMB09164.1 glucosamine-6-phosphate deaminase [Thermolongibacillus altinsuensis]